MARLRGHSDWVSALCVLPGHRLGSASADGSVRLWDTRNAVVELDESEDYGEDRFLLTGRVGDGILVVVYTEREERVRIISAREATDYERRNYYRAAQED